MSFRSASAASVSGALVAVLPCIPVAAADPAAHRAPDRHGPVSLSPAYIAQVDEAADEREEPFRLGFEAAWMYGPVDGHVQTPSGGRPGSTSRDRPTLEELGIEDAGIFDAEVTLGWAAHEFYLGGQWFGTSGEGTLDEALVSEGDPFPAGSRVDADVQLDWYRVGYGYRIEAGAGPGDGPRFVIRPAAGFALLAFDLQLEGPGGAKADRAYTKGAPHVGVAVEWRATDRLSVSGELTSTIALSNTPLIQAAGVVGRYRLFGRGRADVSLSAGVAFERIRYQDNQEVRNQLDIEAGPLLRLGVEARF